MPKPKAQKRAEAEARNAVTPPERRKAARRACPTGKVRYADAHEAQCELVGRIVSRNRGQQKRQERRVYQCPKCGGWHLTSQPLRAERGARDSTSAA